MATIKIVAGVIVGSRKLRRHPVKGNMQEATNYGCIS